MYPFHRFAPFLRLALGCSFLCWSSAPVRAQELREHPTPFSVWLDFKAIAKGSAAKSGLPMWLESVNVERQLQTDGTVKQTVFRLRLRPFGELNREIQLRLFFEDRAGAAPTVTGWTETGTLRFQSEPLGTGLDLPTSTTLAIPVEGVNYVDITVPGNGETMRGAFVATTRRSEIRTAFDFPLDADAADPFGNASPAKPQENDSYLFGRVKAVLEAGTLKLSSAPGQQEAALEFSLDKQPLVALVTFEVLNADLTFPPEVLVNGRPLGAVAPQLPDLADIGFGGEIRPLEGDMRFRYSGWLHCQKLIPGSALHSGLNQLSIRVNNQAGSIAVRTVEIQLKHHWQNFVYSLNP